MNESNNIRKIIEKFYGEPAVVRINKRLLEKYGITFDTASKNQTMTELNDILKEEFNLGYNLIIDEFLKSESKNKIGMICINRTNKIMGLFIECLGDLNALKILKMLTKSMSVYNISVCTQINLSTTYRKIVELSSIGLIIKEDIILDHSNKRYGKYVKTFEKIFIEHNDITSEISIFPKKAYTQHIQNIINSNNLLKY